MPGFVPTPAIENPSLKLQVVLRWIDAFVMSRDTTALAECISEDYKYQMLPKSLGRPQLDRESFLVHAEDVIKRVANFEATVLEVIENADSVILHATSTAISIGATNAPFANEYAFIAHVAAQADGSYKVASVKEFVDSKVLVDVITRQGRKAEEHSDSDTA
ncbi:hypothetical protein EIP91_004214 [Steccherinum ochraceum]|uniref:SnoaL-like domain-containing protein n=1 Tax=Steccherinum ochraceum TaxID=92696 RepID=A0A4R0RFE9_9APHY|nr:hypothetical protein EIP91_004214 [Steccherinum ochraceum]